MLDPKLLRTDLDGVARALARRGFVLDRARFTELEAERKRAQVEVESLRQKRNERSKEIGRAKAAGQDVELGRLLAAAEQALEKVGAELDALAAGLPNIPHDSVPDGADETSNVEVRRRGEPPRFDFEPQDHVSIGQRLGLVDFDAAAK